MQEMKTGHFVWILGSEDGKAVRGREESRQEVFSKWLTDLAMLNLEKKNLREDGYCFLVHSFLHSCLISCKSWPKVHFYSTITTLVKTISTLTPTLRLLICVPPLYFYSIYHLLINCTMFIMFIVGFSPQNCKPRQEIWGVLVTTVPQHLEQCLVVSTHLLTE